MNNIERFSSSFQLVSFKGILLLIACGPGQGVQPQVIEEDSGRTELSRTR